MAEKKDLEIDVEETEEAPKKKGGSKMTLIIIIVAVLLVVGGSIGATLYFLSSSEDTIESESESEEEEVEEVELQKEAIYQKISPAFVVNFQGSGKTRYLQVHVTVMGRDPDAMAALEVHMPLIKNNLTLMFSSQNFDELKTPEGKEKMRQQSTEAIQAIMQKELKRPGIETVLFTNFVMQ